MTEPAAISEAEWRVMEVIWDKKSALAAEVIDALAESQWNHRTIRTLLSRLVDKGILSAEPIGNRNRYSPSVSRTKCVKEAGQGFLKRIFGGDSEALLLHFAKNSKMDADQIERLRDVLTKRKVKDR